jgi:hypothetical protein
VIALLRYQAAILLRSYRWIFPLILYGVLLGVGFSSSEPLTQGMDWSAAILVPAVALLTRSMLTAEPAGARACVAAAAGPVRAQLATLLAAAFGGVVLAVIGICYTVLTDGYVLKLKPGQPPPGPISKAVAAITHPATLSVGVGMLLVCLLVGCAVGALCNPPLLRHPAMATISTIAAVIFAVASDVSPAGAALREGGITSRAPGWPVMPFAGALVLLAVTWTASTLAAARGTAPNS